MTWRVEVDQQKCVGSGMCVGVAPARFTLVDGKSRPPAGPVAAAAAEEVLAAATCCPVEAITITDLATGDPVPGQRDG